VYRNTFKKLILDDMALIFVHNPEMDYKKGNKLVSLKIENFKRRIGIAEKTYKTRRDRWGGNVNHKSLF